LPAGERILQLIIDVHVHVVSLDLQVAMESYRERDPFFRQISSSPVHRTASAGEVLAAMDAAGISQAVICGYPFKDPGLRREMNSYLLEAARLYPGRFLPLAAVYPHEPRLETEIAGCLERGAAGVGELFPWGQGFDLHGEAARRLAAVCQERAVPLLVHINEEVGHSYAGKGNVSVKQAAEFALAHPQLTIIYAHWGGGLFFYELMPELKKQFKNVYYDTAASPFLYCPAVYRVAREVGVLHKILLGTDYPLLPYRRYFKELDQSGLTAAERRMVEGDNARRLFENYGSQCSDK
jgi:predicted TIM-barrel fold metal-dependent hydrolase